MLLPPLDTLGETPQRGPVQVPGELRAWRSLRPPNVLHGETVPTGQIAASRRRRFITTAGPATVGAVRVGARTYAGATRVVVATQGATWLQQRLRFWPGARTTALATSPASSNAFYARIYPRGV